MSTGKGVGHPLKFESPEALQLQCDDFFLWCDIKKEPYTITGLAIHLDTYRSVLLEYRRATIGRRYPQYSSIIKKAVQKVEQYSEKMTHLKGNPAGPIFILKNFGWTDVPREDPEEYEDDGFEDVLAAATKKAFSSEGTE